MRTILGKTFWMLPFLLIPSPLFGEERQEDTTEMREDADGELTHGEFVRISPNGSITRALCPYTCEMRQLPKEHCKTWHSQMSPTECYVQDTRIPSDAVRSRG